MIEDGTTDVDLTDLSDQFGADTAVVETLHRIAVWAADAIESMAFVSIVLTTDGEVSTVVSTDAEGRQLERTQFETRDGPSFDAGRTGRICRVPSTAANGQWQTFREVCRARGVLSTASFPLASEGVKFGAMTLYSNDYHAFGTHETRLGRSFADQAVTAILDARADALADDRSGRESSDRGTREIDRAQRVIMASTGVTADMAMAVLVTQALDQGRKLEDVATEMVNSKIVPLSATDTA